MRKVCDAEIAGGSVSLNVLKSNHRQTDRQTFKRY